MMDIKFIAPCLLLGAMGPVAIAQDHEHDAPHSADAHDDHEDHHAEGEHDDHEDHHADEEHDDHDAHHSDEAHDQGAGSAHVHGAWSLFAAIDDDTLSVTLTGPLQDVLGFESKPNTSEEREAVEVLLRDLSEAERLITPDPRGQCDLADSVDIDLPEGFVASETDAGAHDGHDDDGHEDDEHDDHGDHDHTADVDINLTYTCGDPDRLSELQVGIFSMYPSIETVESVFLGEAGQVAARLRPEEPALRTR